MARAIKNQEERFAKRITKFEKGGILFQEGDEGEAVYVIHRGQVQLFKKVHNTNMYLETLGPGEFCGELALLLKTDRPVTATAMMDCDTLLVSGEQFEAMLASSPKIASRMLKKLVARLTRMQFRIANFSLRQTLPRLLHQLKWEATMAAKNSGFNGYIPLPFDLHEVLVMEKSELNQLMEKLSKEGLVKVNEQQFKIVDLDKYDRYLAYLELKDKFDYLD